MPVAHNHLGSKVVGNRPRNDEAPLTEATTPPTNL